MARDDAGVVRTVASLLDRLLEAPTFYLLWLPQLWAISRVTCRDTGWRVAHCDCPLCPVLRSD